MKRSSILICRMFDVPIRVNIFFILMLLVLAYFYPHGLLFGLLFVTGILISLALHELGHSVVAMYKGCHVQEIVLSPIGGVAKMSQIPSRPRDEFMIAIAGPLVSLAIGIWGSLGKVPFLTDLGIVNLSLFAFNLLPCFPMDGGRVLRAVLAHKIGRLEATRMAVRVAKYFCAVFVIFGLFGFPYKIGPVGPLLPIPVLIFIGMYIYQAGKVEYRMVRLEHQANNFSGYREGDIEVEVSPPPYATGKSPSFLNRLRSLFLN